MTAMEGQYNARQDLWAASRGAECRGNFSQALEIHKLILDQEEISYAASLRAGWLCYKTGSYEESLRYYERACALSHETWPLYGIMNCLTALGKTESIARVARSIYEADAVPAARPAEQA